MRDLRTAAASMMDFSWSETQQSLYDETVLFARDRLAAGRAAGAQKREYAPGSERWRTAGEHGLLGLSAPEEFGGGGFDALTTARVMEALGYGCDDMGLTFSIAAHLFACTMPLAEFGKPELRSRMLSRLCRGEWIGANAATEAEAGSDVFAMCARAERDGDGWVLNGVKSYVTNGPLADVTLVYAKTDREAGYLGVSAFVVERGAAGFRFGEPFEKMGLRSAPIASLYLEDCRVGADALLGTEGQGAEIFRSSMQWERACLFAAYVGQMERQLETAVAYARERRQFGKRLGSFQAISHRIANMKLRLESARLLLYKACWALDRGADAALDISLAKLAVSEAAVQSGLDAIQIHGGIGYTTELGIERELRDAIPATLFSGTSEIQRDLIARELGL
jgi:alkylation response protein AidB-like acyl-CoA dehydrogenase